MQPARGEHDFFGTRCDRFANDGFFIYLTDCRNLIESCDDYLFFGISGISIRSRNGVSLSLT